ncbi:MAG: PKD domain-containing protein, partial [Proteobacteria bacterium]|nr:PKD domain-containing protein [Pseudomonadota bacterium]
MALNSLFRSGVPVLSLIAVAACGGGGGDDGGAQPPTNRAPTANAGADQDVVENATVELDGTGSGDPDGDSLSYAWVQIGTPAVSLSGADTP